MYPSFPPVSSACGGRRCCMHYKDGGSTSVIPELSLWAACVILLHTQFLVSPLQLLTTVE